VIKRQYPGKNWSRMNIDKLRILLFNLIVSAPVVTVRDQSFSPSHRYNLDCLLQNLVKTMSHPRVAENNA